MNKKVTVFSWAMYDFANTIFAMNVISRYFALWVTVDMKGEDILYGLSFAIAMLLAGVFEPIMGTISDIYQQKKFFLIFFTSLCCLFTALIGLTKSLLLGLSFFIIANLGYQLGAVFYNALLSHISCKEDVGRISGLGVSLGYLGTISGLLFVWPCVARAGRQAAFLPTGVLFFLFALPCFLFVKEKRISEVKEFKGIFYTVKESFLRIRNTFFESKRFPGLISFLFASFVFLVAVSTVIIYMSIYAKKVIGLTGEQINIFYIVSAIFPIIGSLLFGFLADRIGPLRCLRIVLVIWAGSLTLAAFAWHRVIFWIVGPLVGVALGSTWVASKSLAIHLCPAEKIGELFGLFGLAAKASAALAALIWGLVVLLFGSLGIVKYRIAVLLQLLFILGGWLILKRIPLIMGEKDG